MATEKCPLCGRKTENGKCEQCGDGAVPYKSEAQKIKF